MCGLTFLRCAGGKVCGEERLNRESQGFFWKAKPETLFHFGVLSFCRSLNCIWNCELILKASIFELIIFAYVSLCCPCLRNWESPSILCASNFALCTGISSRGRGVPVKMIGTRHVRCPEVRSPNFSGPILVGCTVFRVYKSQCTVPFESTK